VFPLQIGIPGRVWKHRRSSTFVFNTFFLFFSSVYVGTPGCVWTFDNLPPRHNYSFVFFFSFGKIRLAWHGNVSALPSTIYLRAELAKQASLRGCIAIPLKV
jgi:hypothetical protein